MSFPCPNRNEGLELGVRSFRQNNFQLDELVAVTSATAGRALAFQAHGRPGVRSFRCHHGHVAGRRRKANPPAKHGLGKRNRHFQRDVVALALEATVGQNLDLDQRVPRTARARSGCSFAPRRRRICPSNRPGGTVTSRVPPSGSVRRLLAPVIDSTNSIGRR
jgi:hypothetical protein